MDRVDDPGMRSAAAHIALQRLDNFVGTGIRIGRKKTHAAQDHSGRAVSALERARIEKCLLHRMEMAVLLEAFNRGDGFCHRGADRNLARPARRSAKQDGACAALSFAAAILGARQAQFVAENGEERRFRIALDRITLAVDFEFDRLRHRFLSLATPEKPG